MTHASHAGRPAIEPLESRTLFAANAIVAENLLPGSSPAQWDIAGNGDLTLQGFATDISVNHGQTVNFKINDATAGSYHVDIYRLGYYGGLGARKVGGISSNQTLRQVQPRPLTDPRTHLVDCGNWAVSASWNVPADATSGVYVADLIRDGTGAKSQIVFIVRDDTAHSDLLFKTSDTTWEAYNSYGGYSLYRYGRVRNAAMVSYNRPLLTRGEHPTNSVFHAEYPMIRWMEANGYNVSYAASVDVARNGSQLFQHKTLLSVGHDEYWSGGERASFEAARNAGVNLAFFSGNECFWKTRWDNSIDGANTPFRTLVCYKETAANAKVDPARSIWTGTWRDPRFASTTDGGRPENALSGTAFLVNGPAHNAITVPADDGKMRFWRNTPVAQLNPGGIATFATDTLGNEWDNVPDNGFRPAGQFYLSSTTVRGVKVLQNFGTRYAVGTATHHLSLYKAASGALVFGAGTVQWSWGLDATHDGGGPAADARMQQATVNLLADMGAQPASLQPPLVPASASTDLVPPVSHISWPFGLAAIRAGQTVTILGTAADTGGVVAGVEVSVDGGLSWHPASGRENWAFTWTPQEPGPATIMTRAVDDSGNLESSPSGVTVQVQGESRQG